MAEAEILVQRLREIFDDGHINPMEKARLIAIAFRDGKRNVEFTNFLHSHNVNIPPDNIGHWTTGYRIMPDLWVRPIVDVFKIAYNAQSILTDVIVDRTRLVLQQGREEKGRNLCSLLAPRVPDNLVQESQRHSPSHMYSYRVVKDDEDLNPFVTLSHNELVIQRAHSELTPLKRRELYQNWFEWSKRSFMYLAKLDTENGIIEPAVISIILPLTEPACERMWRREVDAVNLSRADLDTNADPPCLLLDTWIRKPQGDRPVDDPHERVPRIDHEGYGGCLLPLHIGLFWNGEADLTLLVEPAPGSKTESMCNILGCSESETSLGALRCCRYDYSERDGHRFWNQRLLKEYVLRMKEYPILGGPDPTCVSRDAK